MLAGLNHILGKKPRRCLPEWDGQMETVELDIQPLLCQSIHNELGMVEEF